MTAHENRISRPQKIAFAYAVILALVAGLNLIPGLKQDDGTILGVFALDFYDDMLHAASALWAGIAGWLGRRAALTYLIGFGALYLGDGLLGMLTGSGYLDAGILIYGIQDSSLVFRLAANAPHLALGGVALLAGLVDRR
ncbi:MAG: hypothetical protein QUV10_03935 [Paracoccaceae bacterium]|jgi:hypothetical protein|uniref:hypothetical protein n=1 Tax=unclassified Seohaeicola TaxID=2641111 RepID=UPI00237BD7FE|nr:MULTISPECIES: hypothetical protein [unclassified Seohaeicola]MDD9706289.1 hypothetical protein [Seohaeicola sp. 4SK31]MDD9734748.1 hypothetical protein [Seohaeicola sp. SP36]MDF1708996.1 hypothetical protein [Paracoccaceae bacterium]MDM7968741.1 hypothetical protein [Paracoccaceae bacterium]